MQTKFRSPISLVHIAALSHSVATRPLGVDLHEPTRCWKIRATMPSTKVESSAEKIAAYAPFSVPVPAARSAGHLKAVLVKLNSVSGLRRRRPAKDKIAFTGPNHQAKRFDDLCAFRVADLNLNIEARP